MEIFITAESYLISQLSKLIESSYKEKTILEHQFAQLEQQKSDLDDKILCFKSWVRINNGRNNAILVSVAI